MPRSRLTSLLSCSLLLAPALIACGPRILVEQPGDPRPEQSKAIEVIDQREALRTTARAYAEALTQADGEAAAAWVVPETFDFYEELRVAASSATRAQLEARDLLTLIMVLELRARMDAASLAGIDGRGLFEQAIAEGLAGEGIDEIELDEIWIDDEGLRGELRLEGQTVLTLRREGRAPNDRWLVDVPTLIARLTTDFEALARERISAAGKLETALAFVELRVDAAIDAAILDGPMAAPAE